MRNSLLAHFRGVDIHALVSSGRTFPASARVDLQKALDAIFGQPSRERETGVMGFHAVYNHDTVSFSHLIAEGSYPVLKAPLQYDEVDVGEVQPERCLKNALWLCRCDGVSLALMTTPSMEYGQASGVRLEVAVPAGDAGRAACDHLLGEIQSRIAKAGTYRGKAISLERLDDFSGRSKGLKVHRLLPVRREDLILDDKTIRMIERNVIEFAAQRTQLAALGLSLKKGLLFHGAPGTGKTYTIRYLAGRLPGHTLLLITAEEVARFDQYMQLARFLQPAIVVIEDVDLIARDRGRQDSPCTESLLNKLLNEMDGLREDAEILFILTTNRPEELESALAARPGRVDQAVEFPKPDSSARKKLTRLYGRGLDVSDALCETVAARTEGATGAFIKELMRRSAQVLVRREAKALEIEDVRIALEEMLFSGGAVNAGILGGVDLPVPPGGMERA